MLYRMNVITNRTRKSNSYSAGFRRGGGGGVHTPFVHAPGTEMLKIT